MPSKQTQTDPIKYRGSELEEGALMTQDYIALQDMEDEVSDCSAKTLTMQRNFKICSLAVGVLIGFFVQLTTLAANIVLLEFWGGEFIETSRKEIIIFSLIWSFLTSVMALLVLGFLRALMTSFFRSLPIVDPSTFHLLEAIHEEMLENMEIRFVMGALVGVCLAWTTTDMLLGMVPQVGYSLLTLSISLFWCRAVMWFRKSGDGLKVYDDDDKEESDWTLESKKVIIV